MLQRYNKQWVNVKDVMLLKEKGYLKVHLTHVDFKLYSEKSYSAHNSLFFSFNLIAVRWKDAMFDNDLHMIFHHLN